MSGQTNPDGVQQFKLNIDGILLREEPYELVGPITRYGQVISVSLGPQTDCHLIGSHYFDGSYVSFEGLVHGHPRAIISSPIIGGRNVITFDGELRMRHGDRGIRLEHCPSGRLSVEFITDMASYDAAVAKALHPYSSP